jgi:hypothetical protein
MTTTRTNTADIARRHIADGAIRFDVASHAQGQVVEVATSELKILGRWVRIERTTDQSLPVNDPARVAYSLRMASGKTVAL